MIPPANAGDWIIGSSAFPFSGVQPTVNNPPNSGFAPSTTDWVAIAQVGSPNTSSVRWCYLNGSRSAPSAPVTTYPWTIPTLAGGLPPLAAPSTAGNYELRYFSNNGYTRIAPAAAPVLVGTLTRAFPFPDIEPGLTANNIYCGLVGGAGKWQQVVSGNIQLTASYVAAGGVPPSNGSMLVQWLIDGQPIAGPFGAPFAAPPFNNGLSLDTTTLTNGTHAVGLRVIDITGGSWAANTLPYQQLPVGFPLIVANGGVTTGANVSQTVPVIDRAYNWRAKSLPSALEFVTYPGNPSLLANPVHAYPVTSSIPAATADARYSGNPSLLRNPSLFYFSALNCARGNEYQPLPRFTTDLAGGVFVGPIDWQAGLNIETAYATELGGVIRHQNQDGGRNDNTVDNYSNFVERPDGLAFTGVDLAGRVFDVTHDGAVTTVCGLRLDRTKLPFDSIDMTVAESDIDTRNVMIGTIGSPGFGDTKGANDLAYDPRDATGKTMFVAKSLDHIIYKADLSQNPPVLTRYAGQDGVSGFTNGSALSATFNEPYSIIIADGSGHDPAGTMYVADKYNCAIRKIDPAGNVTTLFGNQANLPTNPGTSNQDSVHGITGASWSGGVLTIALSASISGDPYVVTGNTIALNQMTPGSLNGLHTITVIDSTHVSIPVSSNPGAVSTQYGLTAGYWINNYDRFSPAAARPLSSAYAIFPQAIRWTSTQNSFVMLDTWGATIQLVDLVAGTVKRIGSFGNNWQNTPDIWTWMDVDTKGTIGPVDDVVFFSADTNPGSAAVIWRCSIDGTYTALFGGDGGAGGGSSQEMVLTENGGPQAGGHYPWAIAISRKQGRLISGGIAETGGVYGWRIAQAADPVVDIGTNTNIDYRRYVRGGWIFARGTNTSFPFGCRPSFATQLKGPAGWCPLGIPASLPFDAMVAAYPDDASLAAYIQGGMGGSVPRPELTGDDLSDMIYYIRRQSLAGSYPTPLATSPDPFASDLTPPVISGVTLTRQSSTSIRVQWTTSKPTYGYAAAGSGGNAGTQAPYNCFIMEPWGGSVAASYRTSHDVTLTNLPPPSAGPTHVVVFSKDVAGNSSASADQAVS